MKKLRSSFFIAFFAGMVITPTVFANDLDMSCTRGVPDGNLPSNCQCDGNQIRCVFDPAG